MSFGIEIKNNAGRVQVDGTYRNLFLVAQGTAPAGNWSSISYPAQTSCNPLVCIRPVSDGTYVGFVSVGAASASYFSDGPFEWAVYGLDSLLYYPGTQYGMQVFNSAGSVVFDSRCEPLRVKTVASGQAVWPDVLHGGSPSVAFNNYPLAINFTPFGVRPWLCINQMVYADNFQSGSEEGSSGDGGVLIMTTNGLGQLIVRFGFMPTGLTWLYPAAIGGYGSYALSPAFGKVRVPIVRR